LEELDRVAGGIVEHDLLAARAGDDALWNVSPPARASSLISRQRSGWPANRIKGGGEAGWARAALHIPREEYIKVV
jgi:hypothetical protein